MIKLLGSLLLGAGLLVAGCTGSTVGRTLEFEGLERTYRLHLPPSATAGNPLPVVFVLHGGGGTAWRTEEFTGFSEISDLEGFVAVYPDAVERVWNDGREVMEHRSHRENINDVGFIAAILDDIAKDVAIDRNRVFVTGISNGAILAHRIAAERSDLVAAIAPVAGGMAKQVAGRFAPGRPVSVQIIQGTDDPLVPFEGGYVNGDMGCVLGTLEVAALWAAHDGCGKEPDVQDLVGAEAACSVTVSTWRNGEAGTEVQLYAVYGGGHTWPGREMGLPEWLVGRTCRSFDATRAIWDFFKSHARCR